MERIKEFSGYQKGILLLSLVMILVFSVVYPITYSKVGLMCNNGYAYPNTFLEMRKENGVTVYEGKVKGKILTFSVTQDKKLTCQYGEKTYGPFTARRDPTAVPRVYSTNEEVVGVEIWEGEEILFRGGVLVTDRESLSMILYAKEDYDFDPGEVVLGNSSSAAKDPMKPESYTILRLLAEPELIYKANWQYFVQGVLFSVVTVVSLLFADALFRFRMSFRVYNAENIYPSDWEIATRYIGWTAGVIVALGCFILGLIPQ